MSSALVKINKRVKQLAKKHPHAKRTSLMKQAGKEYRAGKLKARRKPAAKKAKRKTVKRRRVASVRVTERHTVRTSRPASITVTGRRKRKKVSAKRRVASTRPRKKYVRKVVYKRVGSRKSNTGLIIGLAALGVGVYLLTRPKVPGLNTGQATFIPSSNPAYNSSANNLIMAASAAGAGVSAITKLIQTINATPATSVISLGGNPQSAAQYWQQLAAGDPTPPDQGLI